MIQSKGHIAFAGRFEYFALDSGDIVRAPVECPLRCDVPVRNGARFVGTAAWAKYWLAAELHEAGPAVAIPTPTNPRVELEELSREDLPVVGERVRLTERVDRYPHFVAPMGAIGTVVDIGDENVFAVCLDEMLPGAEEWDNAVYWELDSDDDPRHSLEVLRCTSDDPTNHQGDTCPVHEGAVERDAITVVLRYEPVMDSPDLAGVASQTWREALTRDLQIFAREHGVEIELHYEDMLQTPFED
jgi:hypothetical protein